MHALLEGEQIVDLRKGGLREDGRHFDVPARRFWLYPTAEHQRPELLKAAYRHWTDLAIAAPVGEPITLPGWADVTDVATITEPEHLAALDSKSIWTDDYAQSRLKWKKRDPLWVLVLRVHRLAEPVTVRVGRRVRRLHLVGRRSPASPTSTPSPSEPALSDVAFEAKRKGVREALPADAWQYASGSGAAGSSSELRGQAHAALRAARPAR